jgi:lysine-specific demethylase/histidyl-hydroxylase NO66
VNEGGEPEAGTSIEFGGVFRPQVLDHTEDDGSGGDSGHVGVDTPDRAGRTSSSGLESSIKKTKKRKFAHAQLFNTSLNDSVNVVDETIKHDVDYVKRKYRRDTFSLKRFLTDDHPSDTFDSRHLAQQCLQWLISPYTSDDFQNNCWEKKPLLLKRNQRDYYSHLFSTEELERILKTNDLQYTRNIDIAIYENDERKTLNPDGKVYPAVVWDKYQAGCSIRMLNPQTYSKNVWKVCSILQEHFHSFVGANVYLTPPNSQGFAPHYDDIEAFILQLEGKKTWKVYGPLEEETTLPRFSSQNFKRSDLVNDALITVDLEPGDLLYIPRGFIHEGKTSDEHSLHITLSAAQKHTYGDLFEVLLKQSLAMAQQEDIEFRESLPLNYLSYMGIVNQETNDKRRTDFLEHTKNLFSKLLTHMNVDLSVDHFSKQFIHSALPPQTTEQEQKLTIIEGAEKWENGQIKEGIDIQLDSEIKLLRYGCSRLVVEEDDVVRLYHTIENSRIYRENELQYIEIPCELSGAVEHLMNTYPKLCRIRDLPLDSDDEKVIFLYLINLLFCIN